MNRGHRYSGFTIVELAVVIVVVGILMAITAVTYSGIQDNARESAVKEMTKRANDEIRLFASDPLNRGLYPETLDEIDIRDTEEFAYQYTVDNTTSPKTYGVTVSYGLGSDIKYYGSNESVYINEGAAPGHNWIVWDDSNDETVPLLMNSKTVIDRNEAYSGEASIRIDSTGLDPAYLRYRPVPGVAGQVMTVTMQIKTTSDWNGTSGNSKIRISQYSAVTFRANCGYGGVKADWTLITCNYTLPVDQEIQVTVANDGTVGSIWIDDLTLSFK